MSCLRNSKVAHLPQKPHSNADAADDFKRRMENIYKWEHSSECSHRPPFDVRCGAVSESAVMVSSGVDIHFLEIPTFAQRLQCTTESPAVWMAFHKFRSYLFVFTESNTLVVLSTKDGRALYQFSFKERIKAIHIPLNDHVAALHSEFDVYCLCLSLSSDPIKFKTISSGVKRAQKYKEFVYVLDGQSNIYKLPLDPNLKRGSEEKESELRPWLTGTAEKPPEADIKRLISEKFPHIVSPTNYDTLRRLFSPTFDFQIEEKSGRLLIFKEAACAVWDINDTPELIFIFWVDKPFSFVQLDQYDGHVLYSLENDSGNRLYQSEPVGRSISSLSLKDSCLEAENFPSKKFEQGYICWGFKDKLIFSFNEADSVPVLKDGNQITLFKKIKLAVREIFDAFFSVRRKSNVVLMTGRRAFAMVDKVEISVWDMLTRELLTSVPWESGYDKSQGFDGSNKEHFFLAYSEKHDSLLFASGMKIYKCHLFAVEPKVEELSTRAVALKYLLSTNDDDYIAAIDAERNLTMVRIDGKENPTGELKTDCGLDCRLIFSAQHNSFFYASKSLLVTRVQMPPSPYKNFQDVKFLTLTKHSCPVVCLFAEEEEEILYFIDKEGKLFAWSLALGQIIRQFAIPQKDCFEIWAGRGWLATWGGSEELAFWQSNNLDLLHKVERGVPGLTKVVYSAKLKQMWTFHHNSTSLTFKMNDFCTIRSEFEIKWKPTGVHLCQDSQVLLLLYEDHYVKYNLMGNDLREVLDSSAGPIANSPDVTFDDKLPLRPVGKPSRKDGTAQANSLDVLLASVFKRLGKIDKLFVLSSEEHDPLVIAHIYEPPYFVKNDLILCRANSDFREIVSFREQYNIWREMAFHGKSKSLLMLSTAGELFAAAIDSEPFVARKLQFGDNEGYHAMKLDQDRNTLSLLNARGGGFLIIDVGTLSCTAARTIKLEYNSPSLPNVEVDNRNGLLFYIARKYLEVFDTETWKRVGCFEDNFYHSVKFAKVLSERKALLLITDHRTVFVDYSRLVSPNFLELCYINDCVIGKSVKNYQDFNAAFRRHSATYLSSSKLQKCYNVYLAAAVNNYQKSLMWLYKEHKAPFEFYEGQYSPIDYALSLDTDDMIKEFLRVIEVLEEPFGLSSGLFDHLLQGRTVFFHKFLANFVRRIRKGELSMLQINGIGKFGPGVHLLTHEKNEFNLIVLDKMKTSGQKELSMKFFQTNVHWDFSNYTEGSLRFLEAYRESPEDSFILSPFRLIIQNKWASAYKYYLMLALIFWAHTILYCLFLVMPSVSGLLIADCVALGLLGLYEVMCFMANGRRYLKTPSNWLDLLILVLCGVCLGLTNSIAEISVGEAFRATRIVSMALVVFRAFTHFKVFAQFSYTAAMIVGLAQRIFWLMLVIAYFILFVSLMVTVTEPDNTFGKSLELVYNIVLGNIPRSGELSTLGLVICLVASVFLPIFLMNFLIAQLSNSYSDLERRQRVLTYKELATAILELETLIRLIARFTNPHKYRSNSKWVFLAANSEYIEEQQEADILEKKMAKILANQAQLEGHMKDIKANQAQMKSDIKANQARIESDMKAILESLHAKPQAK